MNNSQIVLGVKIIKSLLLSVIMLVPFYSCSTNDQFKVINLKCEYLENPLGIDVATPRLFWQITTSHNNFKQKAYRILASDDIDKLENNIGDLWDSDTVLSDQSTHIVYMGRKLRSRKKVYWKVKVWDQNSNSSKWSNISSWEIALLNEKDWNAKWIGKEYELKPKAGQKNPAPYFRKSFILNNSIKKARAYVSGIGYYELYINGEKVSDQVLSPNQTNYDKRREDSYEGGKIANMSTRILYVTYDVSDYLHKGKNVIGVVLGNGWYNQMERSEYIPLSFDTPRFIAQIEILQSDSSIKQIVSDKTWKVSYGPILDNNIYFGEIYDARLEKPNWNSVNYDDGKWEFAKVVRPPEGKLCAQMSPPDRVIGTIQPIKISTPNKGIYRYDFGTMFSGWVKLNVKGEKGTKLILKYFEDSGNTYGQTDTYILKGENVEEWQPRFTWHAFRYVEVSGSSFPLTLENLEGKIVHTDVKSVGTFKSSNKLFNRILSDFRKTQLDNMHGGVPTDCPHRERRGYTGDGQIAAQAAIYNFDMSAFYTKWMNDISDGQNRITGYVPNTVPYHSGGGGIAWGSAYIIIPWYMYLYYGDTSILKKHYSGMKKYISYLKNRIDENGLIYINPEDTWDLGEWVPPVPTVIPREFVATAYYYYDLILINKIAAVLNKKSDANKFHNISKSVKESFNNKYYNKKDHSYSIGYQGANVFPLAFGLVEKENELKVFKSLVNNIEERTKGHFDTGMMATPYVLEVLTKYGRVDLAYTIMNRKDYPSYGFNIERGATTLWETWQGSESHSHPMFGSVTAWFYQSLSGINPDPKAPGFKHIIIKPKVVKSLEYVNTSYNSLYGLIKSNWEINNGDIQLKVVIPSNTTASVYIPGNQIEDVTLNKPNLKAVKIENNIIHYKIPSGQYTFISKNISKLIKSPMLSIPQIIPNGAVSFTGDSLQVKIKQYSKDAEIRYTLDEKDPTENSKLYGSPFTIKNNTVVKARTFKKGYKPGYVSTARFSFIDSSVNGINYKFYKGAWQKLPDFEKLKSDLEGKVFNFDLDALRNITDKFAIVFTSNIRIDYDDIYTFYLTSNDGSKLFIDDKLIIDFDGLHGSKTKSGKVQLNKGIHKIKVEYFQAGGGLGLKVAYKSNRIEKQIIQASNLFIDK